ncbi:MAG: HdeA/HdeB family chaperone [Alphaproteobacteria bacterium]
MKQFFMLLLLLIWVAMPIKTAEAGAEGEDINNFTCADLMDGSYPWISYWIDGWLKGLKQEQILVFNKVDVRLERLQKLCTKKPDQLLLPLLQQLQD